MKQLLLLGSFLLYTFSPIMGQTTIGGEVQDEGNQPVHFATVALYQSSDSTYVDAQTTEEDGSFNFKDVEQGNYYLQTTMLGFADQLTDLTIPLSSPLMIMLSQDVNLLTTVEITAKKPLLEQKADRLVVNVEENLTGLNGNVLSVLKKVPGLLIIGDQVKMEGSNTPNILINGKSTQYMDVQSLLKDMPADNIKKIEVIHQPGAEFDAEGTGAILNIILKKNNLFGTNGNVRAGVANGENWKYTSSVNLSHYQGNLNVNAGLSYKNYPYWESNDITRRIQDTTFTQVSDDPGFGESWRGNLSLDYHITDRHSVGIQTRYINWSGNNAITTNTEVDYNTPLKQNLSLLTDNSSDEIWRLRSVNPYYTYNIDTSGQKIEFDVNYSTIVNDGESILTTTEVDENYILPRQKYDQPGSTNIYASKLDYTLPLNNDLTISAGAKYSSAALDNDLKALNEGAEGNFRLDTFNSNHFLFDEVIFAAYSKINFQLDKWSGTAGLRYEDSHSEGYSITIDERITRDIKKLFPSFSLSREISGPLAASVAYSYRINRPRYSNLNPFVYYLDAFTFLQGNPMLRPAFAHSFKFNLMFEKQPFFNIEYKDVTDVMTDLTQQNDATGETNLSTFNLESFKNLNISLYFPLDFIPRASGVGGVIANNNIYDSEYLNAVLYRQQWDFTGFIQTEWTLPYKIMGELSAWYNSGGIEGIIDAEYLYGVDVGVAKKFLDDKLRVNVGIENILAKYMTANINYENMDLSIYNQWDGPVYNLELSYKFGNQHMKSVQKKKSSASDVLNRAQRN